MNDMNVIQAYKYILYFTLAVKQNKEGKYIGKYASYNRYATPQYAILHMGEVWIEKEKHPLQFLLKRCGLRMITSIDNTYLLKYDPLTRSYTDNSHYSIHITNVKHRNHYITRNIRQEFRSINIKMLCAAYHYMKQELFDIALGYLKKEYMLL